MKHAEALLRTAFSKADMSSTDLMMLVHKIKKGVSNKSWGAKLVHALRLRGEAALKLKKA